MHTHTPNAARRWIGVALLAACLLTISSPQSFAHDHRPPWLDEATHDNGLYVDVRAPRVLRRIASFEVVAVLLNVASERDVTIERIAYQLPGLSSRQSVAINRELPSQARKFAQYQKAVTDIHALAEKHDRFGVAKAVSQSRSLLREIGRQRQLYRQTVPLDAMRSAVGDTIYIIIEIQLRTPSGRRTLKRELTIPIQPPLPRGLTPSQTVRYDAQSGRFAPAMHSSPTRSRSGEAIWFAGDQHVHTTYSLDAFVLHGTEEDVSDYAATAELLGLDWMIVTDHSNVHVEWDGTDYYTADQFNAGTAQATAYSQSHELIALYGEEMGLGQTGFWNLPAHYLALPFSTPSTGYIANPSSGLVFGLANCEPEQVIIDRINDAGGFGFIAHPFDSGTLSFAQWDFNNGADGWAGMEIWSDDEGELKSSDEQSIVKWHELLNDIAPPRLGSLAARPGLPNAFPVGLGNSDAHQPALLASTFTYAWMPSISRENMTHALMHGQCVASNGPLVYMEADGARIGETALLSPGDNTLDIWLSTTPEFGPVGDYTIEVFVDGALRVAIPPNGDAGYNLKTLVENVNLQPPDKFITVRTYSADGARRAYANPVWLQFPIAGDMNDDAEIDEFDVTLFVNALLTPANATRYQRFVADTNADGLLDGEDIAGFLSAMLD